MKLHPVILVLIALVILEILIPVTAMMLHDSAAVKNTVYSPSFSETAFKQVKAGDSRDTVAAALGRPLRQSYMLRYPNESYSPHPVVPPELLPQGSAIHQEFWEYSTWKRFPDDFRVVCVALDASGTVVYTRDYVTD